MKRSRCVPLVMLGLASMLSGCSQEYQVQRDKYSSQADCAQDWGDANCKPEIGSGGSSYTGPRYYWDRSAGHPVAVNDAGVHQPMPNAHPHGTPLSHSTNSFQAGTVTRGGFGHSGSGSFGG